MALLVPLWNWFRSVFFPNPNVRFASGVSSPLTASSGIPLGTSFAWAYYQWHRCENLAVKYLLFSNDVKIMSQDCGLLHDALDQLSQWCKVNKMAVNPAKSKLNTFHRNRAVATNHLTQIERCSLVRDLGVIWMPPWPSVSTLTTNAPRLRMLGFILRVVRFGIGSKVLTLLYKALVMQTLEYASTKWSSYQFGRIDRLQAVQRYLSES